MVPAISDFVGGREQAAAVPAQRQAADAASTIAQVLQRAAELSEAGAHEPALALLDRTLEKHPDAAELHTARGWALENLAPARLAEARVAYEAAVALDARQLWASVGLATVLGRLGLADLCPPIYGDVVEQATARAPQEPEYHELLGWCQYRLGRLDEAAATFARALAIDAAWVSVRFDLGLVLLLLGDTDAATLHYRAGLCSLAERGLASSAGPLRVALDDLAEALRQHPSAAAAPAPARVREQLALALASGVAAP